MVSHEIPIRVRYADTDQMGVVYHSRYFEWFEWGRAELMRKLGIPYKTLEEQGVFMPVIEAYCRYRLPARYDDELKVKVMIRECPQAKLKVEYLILKDGGLVGEGYTVHAFLNRQGSPRRPPKNFVTILKKALANAQV